MRKQQQHKRRAQHEDRAEPHGGEAGPPRRIDIARARRQSHPHGRGQTDAQRHHEGERGNGDRDLVRRQRRDAEGPHRQGRGIEQGHFEQHGHANRQAEMEEFRQRVPMRLRKAVQETVGSKAGRPERDDRHRHQGEQVRGGAGEARPHQPQPWQAEMAEDQAIIAKRVEQDGNTHHDHRRHRPAERGGEVAQDLERQRTGQAERQCRRINSGVRRQSRLLMEQQEYVAGEEQSRQQGRRHQRHRPQAHAHHHAHFPALARLDRFGVTAHDMGDHRRDGGNRPGAQQPDEKENGVADGAGRQRLLAEMAQHHRVGGQDDHLGELGCRHGYRQARQFARLRQPCGKAVAGDAGTGIGDVQACVHCLFYRIRMTKGRRGAMHPAGV